MIIDKAGSGLVYLRRTLNELLTFCLRLLVNNVWFVCMHAWFTFTLSFQEKPFQIDLLFLT
jgi:hypothetical protein